MDGHDLPMCAQGWGGGVSLALCPAPAGAAVEGLEAGGTKEVVSKAAGVLAMGLEGVSRWQASWQWGGVPRQQASWLGWGAQLGAC